MKLTIKLDKTECKIFGLFVFIIMPEIFTQFRIPALLFAGLQLIIFFYFFILQSKNKRIPRYLYLWFVIGIYSLWLQIMNWNFADIDKWGRLFILVSDTILIFDFYVSQSKAKELLAAISVLGILYYLINSIMIVLLPGGILKGNLSYYFLGLRTDFLKYFFPFAVANGLYAVYYNKKIDVICFMALSIFNFVKFEVSTAIICLVLLVGLFFFRKQLCVWINIKRVLLISSLLSISFIFLNASSFFSWFIVDILQKDLSLSNRMYIWQEAIRMIFSSNIGFLFGHGIVNSGAFVRYGIYWPAHNQILQWLFEDGLLGTLLIYFFFIRLDLSSKKGNDIYLVRCIFAVMMISGITSSPFGNNLGYVAACFLPLIDSMREQSKITRRRGAI